MKSVLRWGGLALGVAVVVTALWPLGERLFGRKRLRFPYLARSLPEQTYERLASSPGWQRATIRVEPSVELRGLVRKPQSADAPWVLYYPGNDESQLERGHGFLSRLAAQQDFGLAVFAYRGYDRSDGRPQHEAMSRDAPIIVEQLCKTQNVAPARLHVMGFSIGGHFAVHAVRSAIARGLRPASLTLLASVDDIVMYHPSPWEKLTRGEDYQTRPLLADIPAPVLVVQGTADAALEGPDQGRAIARALGDKAQYLELPGVEHVPLLSDPQALERARRFVSERERERLSAGQ